MELIQRPAKTKNSIKIMDQQNMQENFEQQFKTIYDYLDKVAVKLNDVYSETPVEIGDGKYSVEINLGTVEADKVYTKDLSYLDIDEVKDLRGKLSSSEFKYVSVNFSNANMCNYAYIDSNNILKYRVHWSGNIKVTLIYTKK